MDLALSIVLTLFLLYVLFPVHKLLLVGNRKALTPPGQSKPNQELSAPSKLIMEAYNRLPKDSRPIEDIHSVLVALDERFKYTGNSPGNHFYDWGAYAADRVSLTPSRYCSHKNCEYKDYVKLYNQLLELHGSVLAQKQAELDAVNSGKMMELEELKERLNEEIDATRQVTEFIKQL